MVHNLFSIKSSSIVACVVTCCAYYNPWYCSRFDVVGKYSKISRVGSIFVVICRVALWKLVHMTFGGMLE